MKLKDHRKDEYGHCQVHIHQVTFLLAFFCAGIVFFRAVLRECFCHIGKKLLFVDDRVVTLRDRIKRGDMLLVHLLKGVSIRFLFKILHRVILAAVKKLRHSFNSGQVSVHDYSSRFVYTA